MLYFIFGISVVIGIFGLFILGWLVLCKYNNVSESHKVGDKVLLTADKCDNFYSYSTRHKIPRFLWEYCERYHPCNVTYKRDIAGIRYHVFPLRTQTSESFFKIQGIFLAAGKKRYILGNKKRECIIADTSQFINLTLFFKI